MFLFSRADIDEVETEVVEIEAKLDKVRLVFHCPAAAVLAGHPSGAFCFSLELYFISTQNDSTQTVFIVFGLFCPFSVGKCRPGVHLYFNALTHTNMFFSSTNCWMRSERVGRKSSLLRFCIHCLCVSKSTICSTVKSKTVTTVILVLCNC